jgi:hypothetical protein
LNQNPFKSTNNPDRLKITVALTAIVCVSLVINIIGINWGLPSTIGWAPDELIPLRVLEGLEKGFSNGWYYKYPPFHFYILALLYSPFWILHQFQIVDIYSSEIYTILFYLGRGLTLLMSVGLLLVLYFLASKVFDRPSAIFSLLIIIVSCPFVYYSKTLNLDIPYLFWFSLSLFFYLRILERQQLRDYLLFSLMAAIAVATKDQAYAFYLLTPLVIIWQHYRHLKQVDPDIRFKDALLDRKIVYSLWVGFGVFFLLHNLIFNLEGFFKHVNLITSGSAQIRPRYEQNLWGQLKMFRQSLTHLRFSLGWGLYFISILGFLKVVSKIRKYRLFAFLLVPLISYYLFYICIVWYSNVRYLMPIWLILSLCGGKFIAEFLGRRSPYLPVKALVIIAIFIYSFSYSFTLNVLMVNDSRYRVEIWMNQNIEANALVLGAGDRKYLPRLEPYRSQVITEPTLETVTNLDPDYIILTSAYDIRRFESGTAEYQFFAELQDRNLPYRLQFRYQYRPQWYFFNRQELEYRNVDDRYIYSNFDKIDPEITIFKKVRE